MVPDATGLAVGDRHTCALRLSGGVVCWGQNDHGQLGRGRVDAPPDAGPVRGLSDAVELVARRDYTCARRRSGEVVCWGAVPREKGPSGGGVEIAVYASPTVFPSPADVVELAAGDRHVCARTGGGHVVCWGDDRRGQLGGGSTDTRSTSMTVEGLSDAQALALGADFSCASGAVACWGDDTSGQLGDGGRQVAASAVEVALR